MNIDSVKLEMTWKDKLKQEFNKDYIKSLKSFLLNEYKKNKIIYPKKTDYFKAFNLTPFNEVKVVLLGQDPYHNPNQACGLSFCVKKDVKIPPSLKNIYKELENDLNIKPASHGDLTLWAQRGVFLLNSILTVEKNKPASHRGKGWEQFTDYVLSILSEKRENIVFLLWGNDARKKRELIDEKKHLILESPHPSPFSAHLGFLGSKPFSKINTYLENKGKKPIDWALE